MQKTDLAVTALRILLVLAFGLLVFFQVVSIPGQFAHMAEESPDMAYLKWPLTAFWIAEVICAQIIIVCTWKLLSMVQNDRIFSEASMRWVDGIVWAIAVGWTLFFGAFLYFGFKADDPGLPLMMSLFVVGGAVLGLLMIVMRALLHKATTLHSDMESVI